MINKQDDTKGNIKEYLTGSFSETLDFVNLHSKILERLTTSDGIIQRALMVAEMIVYDIDISGVNIQSIVQPVPYLIKQRHVVIKSDHVDVIVSWNSANFSITNMTVYEWEKGEYETNDTVDKIDLMLIKDPDSDKASFRITPSEYPNDYGSYTARSIIQGLNMLKNDLNTTDSGRLIRF